MQSAAPTLLPTIVPRVDRAATARAERRRQVTDALEEERGRAEALRQQIDAIVLELEGPAVDEAAFAAMTPEDAEIVRTTLNGESAMAPEDLQAEWTEIMGGFDEPEGWRDVPVEREELESEITRLEQEIAESTRRQEAFERYLEALGE